MEIRHPVVARIIARIMFIAMLLCAVPAILFAPMTIIGALSLKPLAVIFLSFGVIGILLAIYYLRYSSEPSHDSNQRRKVWRAWTLSICAHAAILVFMQWFIGRVGCVPFSPVSVMAGYLLLISPISVGMILGSFAVLCLDVGRWRSTKSSIHKLNQNAEQVAAGTTPEVSQPPL
jgi:hypothetical protein